MCNDQIDESKFSHLRIISILTKEKMLCYKCSGVSYVDMHPQSNIAVYYKCPHCENNTAASVSFLNTIAAKSIY